MGTFTVFFSEDPANYVWQLRCTDRVAHSPCCPLSNVLINLFLISDNARPPTEEIESALEDLGILDHIWDPAIHMFFNSRPHGMMFMSICTDCYFLSIKNLYCVCFHQSVNLR